jgi:hypothetical protein
MAVSAQTTPAASRAGSRPARVRAIHPGWWVLIGWFGLVVLHVWIARGVAGPIVLQDESGYLGNARWLVGRSPVPEMGDEPVYAWGYSLVIAPLVAAIDDPALLYRAVQALNSLLLASLFPLLWVVLRRVGGVDTRTAALAALVGSLFPATLVHSSVAWAESLLPVLMVALVLAVWWTLTPRAAWQRVLVAPLAVFAYATHPRLLPALALVMAGIVVAAWWRLVPRVVAGVGLVIAGAGFLLVMVVDGALLDARWPDRVDTEGSAVRLLGRLVNPTNWAEVVAGSFGQAWYLAAGSLGVATLGAITGVWWATRSVGWRDPRRLTVIVTGAVMLVLFLTSVVSFVGTAERVDHLVYGRYNEAFVPLLVATGAVGLLLAHGYQRTRLIAAGAGLTAAIGLVLWVGRGPSEFTGEVVWNNVLGLRAAMELTSQRWMVPVATVLAVAVLGGLWVIGRRAWLGVAATGAVLVVMGVVAAGPLADFSRVRYQGWALPEHLSHVAATAGVDEIALDRDGTGLMATLGYPFWLPDLRFRFADRWPGADPPGLAVSAVDDGTLDAGGARIVLLDARNGQAVWTLPGSVAHDRLVEAGAVLPRGFPVELDPGAQAARIARVGPTVARADAEDDSATTTQVVHVAAGQGATVELRVIHAGRGQGWPSDAEWPLPGVVRVGARWYDGDTVIRNDERAPLPAPMWPGDEHVVLLVLRALDAEGQALAPGRYTVGVDMVQEGFTWFADEGTEPLLLDVVVS